MTTFHFYFIFISQSAILIQLCILGHWKQSQELLSGWKGSLMGFRVNSQACHWFIVCVTFTATEMTLNQSPQHYYTPRFLQWFKNTYLVHTTHIHLKNNLLTKKYKTSFYFNELPHLRLSQSFIQRLSLDLSSFANAVLYTCQGSSSF